MRGLGSRLANIVALLCTSYPAQHLEVFQNRHRVVSIIAKQMPAGSADKRVVYLDLMRTKRDPVFSRKFKSDGLQLKFFVLSNGIASPPFQR